MMKCSLESVVDSKDRVYLKPNNAPHIVGRCTDALIKLMVRSASRNHAVLSVNSSQKWTVRDKSANGVYINDKKIADNTDVVLVHGDIIQFGNMASDNNVNMQYKFIVETAANTSPSKAQKHGLVPHQESPTAKMKRLHKEFEQSKAEEVKLLEQKMEENLLAKHIELEELREQLAKKDAEVEQTEERMKEAIEREKQKVEEEKVAMNNQLEKEKQQLRVEWESKKKTMEKELQEQLQQQLLDKETQLLATLQANKSTYIEEREKINETLMAMEKKLEEKDKAAEKHLEEDKSKLDGMIAKMELEQKMLKAELEKCKLESSEQAGSALKMKEDILQCFAELAETELQCCICQELFIKAVTINCSHSFCSHCIKEWRQKKQECPVCRARIVSENRALVIDSYIERMIEHMSDDMKKHRQRVVQERQDLSAAITASTSAASASSSSVGGAGAGGGRGRGASRRSARARGGVRTRGGGARGRGGGRGDVQIVGEVYRAQPPPAPRAPPTPPPVDVWSSSSDSDSSSEEVDGIPGVYYGGWGRCYSCGSRGHWATGCPY